MIIEKYPSDWTLKDLRDAALLIKQNPNDTELKRQFLNIIPESGEFFNRKLYVLLMDSYRHYSRSHKLYIDMDDFMQLFLIHIDKYSFSDWDPEYALFTYFKILLRPQASIGNILKATTKNAAPLVEAEDLNDPVNVSLYSELSVDDCIESLLNTLEYKELVKKAYKLLPFTEFEYLLLIVLDGRNITDKVTEEINQRFKTSYSKKELQKIHRNIRRRIRYDSGKLRKSVVQMLSDN